MGRNHILGSVEKPDKNLTNEVFTLNCAGTLYSFMLSPIIPLPPVIPTYGVMGNGDAWITFNKVFSAENKLSNVKLLDSNDKIIFEQKLNYNSDNIRYVSLPFKCKNLHNTVIQLGYSDTKKDKAYSLVYKKGEVDWAWGYLR